MRDVVFKDAIDKSLYQIKIYAFIAQQLTVLEKDDYQHKIK